MRPASSGSMRCVCALSANAIGRLNQRAELPPEAEKQRRAARTVYGAIRNHEHPREPATIQDVRASLTASLCAGHPAFAAVHADDLHCLVHQHGTRHRLYAKLATVMALGLGVILDRCIPRTAVRTSGCTAPHQPAGSASIRESSVQP